MTIGQGGAGTPIKVRLHRYARYKWGNSNIYVKAWQSLGNWQVTP